MRETVFTLNEVHGKIAAQETQELEVTDLFRLRGQEHELTMTVAVESRRQTNSSYDLIGVPCVKWGLRSPSNFMIKVDDAGTSRLARWGRLWPTRHSIGRGPQTQLTRGVQVSGTLGCNGRNRPSGSECRGLIRWV
jgi:hypothetical protein